MILRCTRGPLASQPLSMRAAVLCRGTWSRTNARSRECSGWEIVAYPWRVFSGPSAIQAAHADVIGQTWPVPIIPAARLRQSANTPPVGEIFHKIGGGHNAFGRFGHPSGDLAGSGGVLRAEDGAQVRD